MQNEAEATSTAAAEAKAIYDGDTGSLPAPARRALIALLNGPALEKARAPELWEEFMNYRGQIESRLSEMYLKLVYDTTINVAFTRQVSVESLDYPKLLRTVPLTFIDSALLLHLRFQLGKSQILNERCVVERDEVLGHLELYERTANTDAAGFKKRVHSSFDKMVKNSILHKVRNSSGRYEVSPTLKLLFEAENVAALSEDYRKIRDGELRVTINDDEGGAE